MKKKLPHFIITRFGIGINSLSWYENSVRYFKYITLPSIENQTDKNFFWLIVVDQNIPQKILVDLRKMISIHDNFHIVSINLMNCTNLKQGGFEHLWNICKNYLYKKLIICDPLQYVITSLLDADDAWNEKNIAIVNTRMASEYQNFLGQEKIAGSLICNSGGAIITFPKGLTWYPEVNVVESTIYPNHSMSTFVCTRISSGISAASCRHKRWPSYANVVNFSCIEIETEEPMWVYTRHTGTEISWSLPKENHGTGERTYFSKKFNINFADLNREMIISEEYLQKAKVAHSGISVAKHQNILFQIAALNDQIIALESATRESESHATQRLLNQQIQTRNQLIYEFRLNADNLFKHDRYA